MLMPNPSLPVFNSWDEADDQLETYQSAIHSPQIAFVSKQFVLVLPAHAHRPSVDPSLPILFATLMVKAAIPAASPAVSETLRLAQFRKLSGLPNTMLTTVKASRRRESMLVMIKRPREAWA